MGRFVEGADRSQLTLLPECLEDWVSEDNTVHVIDVFVEALDLHGLGFERVIAKQTGRPSYHPAVLLKLYIFGYLNRVQSSRRLEREACRNIEVMWLIGRLAPDHKTIADFRKDNGAAIRKVCAKFIALCRQMGLLQTPSVAIDGSKFKAVNNRDRNFTHAKMARRMLDRADMALSIRRQCMLLGIARSGVYRPPRPANDNDLALMRRLDELFTAWPFLGSRRMTAMLKTEGLRSIASACSG
ncbi:transposase [Bradyrhizobium sp. BRP22]|nr:transposase [Bradyrhizobium sp. BRP22]